MNDINKQLKLINNENIIWYIYYIIVTFAIISNKLESDSLIFKDKYKKEIFQKINTIILVVAFFIYLYFTYISIDNIKNNKMNNNHDKRISFERLIVNFLFLVAGAIQIYADYDDRLGNSDLAIF